MTDQENSTDRRHALAALLLDKAENLQGARPTHEELWDWMHGDVTESRSQQITQHLAHDDNLYEDWRQMRLAMDDVDTQKTQQEPSKSNWKLHVKNFWSHLKPSRSGPLSAGLTAAMATLCVLLVFGLQLRQTQNHPDFWQDWQTSKSNLSKDISDATRHDLKTMLSGMRQQLEQMALSATGPDGEPLPESAQTCLEDTACLQRNEVLATLGKTAVIARSQCLSDATVAAIDRTEISALLQSLTEHPSSSILLAPLRRWEVAADGDSPTQCAAIESLISRALGGL